MADLSVPLAPIGDRPRLPNGWPQPTFMSLGDDGSLNIEWCFGEQGADDSWRVMFCWDPDEGAMACKTTHDGQEHREGEVDTIIMLDRWLRGAPTHRVGEEGKVKDQ